MSQRSFGSDNHSGIHPEILKALLEANVDHAHSYGLDHWTQTAEKQFQELFKVQLKCFFVFNGTACNVVGLKGLVQSYESVLCAASSHLNEDECAAPEIMGHFKLIPLPTSLGKLDLSAIDSALIRGGDQHFAQPKVISITTPTEYGTVYSIEELKQLRKICDEHNLYLHIDGARFANALHFLKLDFAGFYDICKPDVISLGGTKNGLMFGEALLVFQQKVWDSYKFLRKQSMQLPSKGRFVAAQFNTYLRDGLFEQIAEHSHKMALLLAEGLKSKGLKIELPVESNAVFTYLPKDKIKLLREKSFFYIWDEKTFLARLMCSFDTSENDIKEFIQLI